MEGIFLAKAHK
uniref:Uncharacterized protein n=1 Tax=Anguilla anguilla TaxID=7936 RepID=A0A0E9T8X4_ANGAN